MEFPNRVTVLFITPPFTQLNTPYPATAYLKGFLNSQGVSSWQCDLGLELILKIFSRTGLHDLFRWVEVNLQADPIVQTESIQYMLAMKEIYVQTIEPVIEFLQGKNPMLAHAIVAGGMLPRGKRFEHQLPLDDAFGLAGIQDKAKYLCTLYLEDLGDFITECIDPHFGFSRYAERLARSANRFDELYLSLKEPLTRTEYWMQELLEEKMKTFQPSLVVLSVPFPGNLHMALRIGEYIKNHFPDVKVAMGGGYPNTELRSLSEKRVFEFVDFITLDDGERPLLNLIEWMNGTRPTAELKRCFCLVHNEVMFCNGSSDHDIPAQEGSTPDYSDLWLDRYISVLEMSNPMHRLWSDGVWLKLTMAHGCYWKKCSFCDIGLPYIGDYQPVQAARIADRMNELIQQTGIRAFHFVDEAAPPVLMKELAIEIIKRKMVVSWWTNIRFEKSFTRDLCFLLKSSGCIGVSGGLEVASDRLLGLIRKGVSVEQVCRVNQHFREAGIMVHAYLMYGFPTQTIQETIDSMEMVRQMFLNGILQSAHWHRFALTVHSPVMANPSGFKIKALLPETSSFANNDVDYKEDHPVDHDRFGEGLRHSLQNYMQHFGLEKSLHEWFDFRTPSPSVEPDFVERIVSTQGLSSYVLHNRVIWMHATPFIEIQVKRKKGREWEEARLEIHSTEGSYSFNLPAGEGRWLCQLLANCSVHQKENPGLLFSEVIRSYEEAGLPDFDLFWYKKPVSTLYRYGLLIV